MKTVAFTILALAMSFAVQAGSQVLPEPSLAQITGISNLGSETPNDIVTSRGHQAITGWSADGTKLYGVTTGVWTYGYRGSRVASWCGTLTWTITVDPATGTLDPIASATFTPGNCSGALNSSTTFAFGGFAANAAPQQPLGWSAPADMATLYTP